MFLFIGFQNEVPDAAKPFREDPAKQGRFEQFLKDKYHGGLRSKDSSGFSYMSEAARARERLEFEAAAEAIRKGKWGKETSHSNQQMWDMPVSTSLQFTPAGLEVGIRNCGIFSLDELIDCALTPTQNRKLLKWKN